MGEIADGILEGDFCQYCCDYIGEGNGFPVTCEACRQDGIEEHLDEKTETTTRPKQK